MSEVKCPLVHVRLHNEAPTLQLTSIPDDVMQMYNDAHNIYRMYGSPEDRPPCPPQHNEECFKCWRTTELGGEGGAYGTNYHQAKADIEEEICALLRRPLSSKGMRIKVKEVFASRGLDRSDFRIEFKRGSKIDKKARGYPMVITRVPGKTTVTIERVRT